MKIYPYLFLLILFPALVLGQQEQYSIFNEEELNWIKNNPVIEFGYDPGWKPIEFVNKEGKHDGITADFLKLLSAKTGLEFKPYPNITEWSQAEELIQSKEILLLPALAQNERRNAYLDFTQAFFSYSFVIVTRKNSDFIGGLEDLDGKTIAAPKSYYISGLLEQEQIDMNFFYQSSIEDCLMAVATEKADATVTNLTVASHYMNYSGYDNLKIAAPTPYPEIDIKMGVAKGEETLLNILKKGISQISQKEKNQIIQNWVSVQFEHGIDMQKIWRIAGVSLGIVCIVFLSFVYWNRKLKKEVSLRKEAEEQLRESFLEISEQKKIIELKNEEVLDSIKYAKRLQEAILPPIEQVNEQFESNFIFYQPKDIVAGDFYWMEKSLQHPNKTYIAAADCTGHGVPGALVSVVCSNALNQSVLQFHCESTGDILDKATDLVIERFERSKDEVKDGMDICLISVEYQENEILIEYSGAHNSLLIVSAPMNSYSENIYRSKNFDKVIFEVKADKQPVGKFEHYKNFKTNKLKLKMGDRVYLCSDGYADQFGGQNGKKLKPKSLKEKLLETSNFSMSEQKQALKKHFNDWKGDYEQLDDVCIIGLEL